MIAPRRLVWPLIAIALLVVAATAAPFHLGRPGPPRAVPPNRAAHPAREKGDARRDRPPAPLRTAPRAGAALDRERDARQRDRRAAARGAHTARSGLRPREPPLAPVPRLSLGDGRAVPAGPPARRQQGVRPAARPHRASLGEQPRRPRDDPGNGRPPARPRREPRGER